MTGTTACFSKQQTVEMIIPWEQGWCEGEEAHRLQEVEIQLEKVGKVSMVESRAAQHSCLRKATSVLGVRYCSLVTKPIKWPSVRGFLIYRCFNSIAYYYLIDVMNLAILCCCKGGGASFPF